MIPWPRSTGDRSPTYPTCHTQVKWEKKTHTLGLVTWGSLVWSRRVILKIKRRTKVKTCRHGGKKHPRRGRPQGTPPLPESETRAACCGSLGAEGWGPQPAGLPQTSRAAQSPQTCRERVLCLPSQQQQQHLLVEVMRSAPAGRLRVHHGCRRRGRVRDPEGWRAAQQSQRGRLL